MKRKMNKKGITEAPMVFFPIVIFLFVLGIFIIAMKIAVQTQDTASKLTTLVSEDDVPEHLKGLHKAIEPYELENLQKNVEFETSDIPVYVNSKISLLFLKSYYSYNNQIVSGFEAINNEKEIDSSEEHFIY